MSKDDKYARKEKEDKSPQDKLEQIQKNQLTFQANSLNEEVAEHLNDQEKAAVAIIGREISQNGLTTKEACKVANISYEAFNHKYENNPTFKKIIDFKKLEYKRDLKQTIHAAIRNGEHREAAKMYRKMFPDDFGENTEEKQNNLLRQAIEFARENSDIQPLVEDKGKDKVDNRTEEQKDKDYNKELSKLVH